MKREKILEKSILFLAGDLQFNKENCEKLEMFNSFTKKINNEISFKIYLGNVKQLLKRFAERKNIYPSDRKKIVEFLKQF